MMFYVEGNYQKCSTCAVYTDDGGVSEGQFTCHDCLDRKYIAKERNKNIPKQ